MLITESKIRQIIAEELETLLEEQQLDEGFLEKAKNYAVRYGVPIAAAIAMLKGANKAEEMSATPGLGSRSAESGIASYLPSGEKDINKDRPKPKKIKISNNSSTGAKKGTTGSDNFRAAVDANKKAQITDIDIAIANSGLSDDMKSKAQQVYDIIGKYNPSRAGPFLAAIKQAKRLEGGPNANFANAIYAQFGDTIDSVTKAKLAKIIGSEY